MNRKKFLALILALAMALSLAACGGGGGDAGTAGGDGAQTYGDGDAQTGGDAAQPGGDAAQPGGDAAPAGNPADAVEDNMTSADGTYEIAFVTDIGQLKDKSFNEGTWNGVKLYASENSKSYKYYQPANGNEATDDDRYNAMKAAADAGAKVVVCAGFLQEGALRRAAADYPNTMFVFIDGNPLDDGNGNMLPNVAGIAFKEEQCGYLTGYAVVKEGYTKLGFSGGGGGTNPACCRYGYGYVQGANEAAKELGITVDINYSWQYGSGYSASPELQTMCNGWYETGTEIIFACGGAMFQSITAAASANDGLVIGVDTDQSGDSDTVVTSAMKNIGEAAQIAIGKFYDGTWSEIGGTGTSLGATDDSVGLPTATWSMENFTVEEYEQNLQAIKDGTITVDSMADETEFSKLTDTQWSNVKLNVI